jgi:hypothetical protein
MDFLVVEQGLNLIEGLSATGEETFVLLSYDSINSNILEI